MTEEEIEEQAEENLRKNKISNNENWEVGGKHCYTLCKQAFQAGAKWGMEHAIEWHDLKKNPADLPSSKTSTEVPVLLVYKSAIDGEIVVEEHIYVDHEGFICLGSYYQGDYREPPYFKKEGVLIAWCELPQFKE